MRSYSIGGQKRLPTLLGYIKSITYEFLSSVVRFYSVLNFITRTVQAKA